VFAEAIKEKTDIINASLYHENIVRWVNVFGNNVIILIYDLLKLNPDYYARQLCRFLGIEFSAPSEILKSTKVNPLTIPRSLILASIGNKIKTLFRQQRMYFVVEIAKYMGLKELFFGKPSAHIKRPQKTDIESLVAIFSEDLRRLGPCLCQSNYKYVCQWIREMHEEVF
jgi:hypothetical protein